MRTTIDAHGRLVIPKAARDELGFTCGTQLDVTVHGSHLEVAVAPVAVRLVEEDGVPVLVPEQPQPPLTVEAVRDLVERGRR